MRLNPFRLITEWWYKRQYLKKAQVILERWQCKGDVITTMGEIDGPNIFARVMFVAARPDDPKQELLIFRGEAIGLNESGNMHILLPYKRWVNENGKLFPSAEWIAVPLYTLCIVLPPLPEEEDD